MIVALSLEALGHPLSGEGYQFWSGIGSDIGQITLVTMAIGWWTHVNCSTKGCWRKGHSDPEHGHPVCRKHQDKLSD